LTDQLTKENLIERRSGYEKIISEIKVISVPSEYSQKETSRWLKTSMWQCMDDDFLYIDCDTIVTDKLDFTFPPSIIVGAVLDTHVSLPSHHLQVIFQNDNKKLGFLPILKNDKYFNGGLIYCKNCAEGRAFFEKWHELWLYSRERGNSQDMPSLNRANHECNGIITELPGEWNCQISHNGLPYLHNAKNIHYNATSLESFIPAYKLASLEILVTIKLTGEIPKEALKMLEDPKSAFEAHSRIIADPVVIGVFDGSLFSKLIWLNKKHPQLFKKCDNFMAVCTRITKKIIGKK
jgi:hypothetical protein